jgi:hypothetical protein
MKIQRLTVVILPEAENSKSSVKIGLENSRFTYLHSTDTPYGIKTSPGPKILK